MRSLSTGLSGQKKGAIVYRTPHEIKVFKNPFIDDQVDVWKLEKIFLNRGIIVIEQQANYGTSLSKGTRTALVNYGQLLGAARRSDNPVLEVMPRKWKTKMKLNSDKQKSIDMALKLFPQVSLRHNSRCSKDDDNIAEALLLTEYYLLLNDI